MKSILLCIAFSIFSICTIAQEAQQSVELKDGSIVVGEILKKYDNGSVKINTAFGIVILSADTIAEIRDSVTPLRKDTATARLPIQYQPVIQQTQDKELRTHIEAYRKTLATGYTLEVAGIALLIGGSFIGERLAKCCWHRISRGWNSSKHWRDSNNLDFTIQTKT